MTGAELMVRLSVRQRQVLKRVGAGMGYRAIAADLGISRSTVKVYTQQLAALIGYGHLPALAAVRQFAHEYPTD